MPNRILRDGAMHSRAVNALSIGAECLFYHLLMIADDFGLFESDTFALKSRCFCLRPEVGVAEMEAWIAELQDQELVRLYEAGGRKLGAVNKWNQVRWASKPKFALPEWGTAHIVGGYQRPAKSDSPKPEKPTKGTKPKRINGAAHGFDEFYAAYPRHVDRAKAEKAWLKINPDAELQARILQAVAVQKRSPQWVKDNGSFIPHPTSWLNGKRWEDDTASAPQLSADRPSIKCGTCGERAFLWTGHQCDRCWRKAQGFNERSA